MIVFHFEGGGGYPGYGGYPSGGHGGYPGGHGGYPGGHGGYPGGHGGYPGWLFCCIPHSTMICLNQGDQSVND